MSEHATTVAETELGERARVEIWEVGEPLPAAVADDSRKHLSAAARAEIKDLMRPDPAHFVFQVVLTWGTIVAAIALAEYLQSVWATALAVVIVATRQNVLGLLMHEQAHRIAFRSRFGDYFCNLTCCCPLFLTVESYRRIHLTHHQCYFTPADPDYRRKQGRDWTFPKRVWEMFKLFLPDLALVTVVMTLRNKGVGGFEGSRNGRMPIWVRLLYYAAWAAFLTWAHLWVVFLIYWLLPMATVLQLIVRWGAICEHKYNLINPSLGESTPIIEPRWWERLVLPNLNFTLHVYHHYYPVIPYAKLPRVHAIFRREGLVNEENVFRGYGPYLRLLLGKPKTAASCCGGSEIRPAGSAIRR